MLSLDANPGIQTQRGTVLSTQSVFIQIILLSKRVFTWDDLQQQHEFQSIPEVLLDVLNLRSCFPQVRVTPSCKCLQRRKKERTTIIGHCTYSHIICCSSQLWQLIVISFTLFYNLLTMALQCIKLSKANLINGRIMFGLIYIRAAGCCTRKWDSCPAWRCRFKPYHVYQV